MKLLHRKLYGRKKSSWTIQQSGSKIENTKANEVIQKIARFPQSLKDYTLTSLKRALEEAGSIVKPLGRGALKGVSFEDGGGFKVNFGGDGIIQYHPKESTHHKEAYYKVSTGKEGVKRYDLNGKEMQK